MIIYSILTYQLNNGLILIIHNYILVFIIAKKMVLFDDNMQNNKFQIYLF